MDRTSFLGLALSFSPDYLGSDDYELEPDVLFQLKLGKRLEFDSDGLAFNFLNITGVEFGPVFAVWQRPR